MQFRILKKRVQVFAYSGYDKNRKRSAIKMIGSFPIASKSLDDIPFDLLEALDSAQREELHAWLQTQVARRAVIESIGVVADAPAQINSIVAALDRLAAVKQTIAPPLAAAVQAANARLRAALARQTQTQE